MHADRAVRRWARHVLPAVLCLALITGCAEGGTPRGDDVDEPRGGVDAPSDAGAVDRSD